MTRLIPKDNLGTIGILQPSYLPWIGYFEQIACSQVFVLYDDVQFEKGAWRNRNRIKTPSGAQWLTVPVLLKGRDLPLIKDVIINQAEKWQKKHIRSIEQHYRKAPFFNEYAGDLFDIIDRKRKYLIDLNLEIIYWIVQKLDLKTTLKLSSQLNIGGSGVQRLIDIIRLFNGRRFYEGAAGRNYIDPEDFKRCGIDVVFQDYNHPVYPQLYGDFVSHLSVIDLMFNCGSESTGILTQNMEIND